MYFDTFIYFVPFYLRRWHACWCHASTFGPKLIVRPCHSDNRCPVLRCIHDCNREILHAIWCCFDVLSCLSLAEVLSTRLLSWFFWVFLSLRVWGNSWSSQPFSLVQQHWLMHGPRDSSYSHYSFFCNFWDFLHLFAVWEVQEDTATHVVFQGICSSK